MPIDVKCKKCSKSYRVPDTSAGKNVACKNCGGVIAIPIDDVEIIAELEPAQSRPAKKKKKPRPAERQRSTKRSPAQRSRPARPKPRDRVIEDFEELDNPYDHHDDPYDDPLDLPLSRGRKKQPRRDSAAYWARIGLLIVAIAACFRTLGFTSSLMAQLLTSFDASLGQGMMLNFLKIDLWVTMFALVGMLVGYVFLLFAPDREGSQTWAIAAVVLSVIATGLYFFMRIMPLIDPKWITPGSAGFGLQPTFVGRFGTSIWQAFFKGWALTALFVSHMFFALMYVNRFFSGRNSKAEKLPRQSTFANMVLAGHLACLLFEGLVAILYIKVILPAVVESAHKAGEFADPPTELFGFMVKGLHWLALGAFLFFLILKLRILFTAQSRAR